MAESVAVALKADKLLMYADKLPTNRKGEVVSELTADEALALSGKKANLTPSAMQALERVKMLPAASGSPGTRISFGKWTRRGWMGAGYLVAREVAPDLKSTVLRGRYGQD